MLSAENFRQHDDTGLRPCNGSFPNEGKIRRLKSDTESLNCRILYFGRHPGRPSSMMKQV